jgi:hypothetical protein
MPTSFKSSCLVRWIRKSRGKGGTIQKTSKGRKKYSKSMVHASDAKRLKSDAMVERCVIFATEGASTASEPANHAGPTRSQGAMKGILARIADVQAQPVFDLRPLTQGQKTCTNST